MYLAYVDDYGHTGADLGNPQQPLYMLFAVLVPESEWVALESELASVITEILTRCSLDIEGFELHAVEFFSGRDKRFSAISFEERIGYLKNLIDLVVRFRCKIICTYLVKSELQTFREIAAKEVASLKKDNAESESISPLAILLTEMLPHPLVFSRLISEISDFCRLAQENGIIVMDHQEEQAASRKMMTHQLYRNLSPNDEYGILDMPFDGDGRYNLILQIVDLLGWAFGKHLKTVRCGLKENKLLSEAVRGLIPLIESIDALQEIEKMFDSPLSMGLLYEHATLTDQELTGNTKRLLLAALIVMMDIKKGKE